MDMSGELTILYPRGNSPRHLLAALTQEPVWTLEESLPSLGMETRFLGRSACSPITMTYSSCSFFFLELITAASFCLEMMVLRHGIPCGLVHIYTYTHTHTLAYQRHLLRPFSEY
jgi:hypothetical protein